MNFRTKDLMVTVLPKDLQAQAVCHFPTLTACWHRCSVQPTLCWHQCSWRPTCYGCTFLLTDIPQECRHQTIDLGPIDCTGTPYCAGSMTPWIQGRDREGIEVLREQLKARITEIDQLAATLQEGPATVAEAETLEAHLKDALSQVQARKAEIKGGAKK